MIDCVITLHQYVVSRRAVSYAVHAPSLTFLVRGVASYTTPAYELIDPGPTLLLHAGEVPVRVVPSGERAGWSVQVRTTAIRSATEPGRVGIRCGGYWATVPAVRPLPESDVLACEMEFRQIQAGWRNPLPREQLLAQLAFAALLRRFLQHEEEPGQASPVARLKRRLDDTTAYRSLERLSRECGYSADHLRRLFVREYGITPLAYRNRCRMVHAMRLVVDSALSVKQIAAAARFRYVSHFTTMFRNAYRMTPSQAIRRFRSGAGDER